MRWLFLLTLAATACQPVPTVPECAPLAPGANLPLCGAASFAAAGPQCTKGALTNCRVAGKPPLPGVAYNGAIARFGPWRIMAYRLDTNEAHGTAMRIAMTELDAQLQPCGAHSLLLRHDETAGSEEDPRLVVFDDALWVVFNTKSGRGRQMRMGRVAVSGSTGALHFELASDHRLVTPGMKSFEKNWSPFAHGNDLVFIYRSNPTFTYRVAATELRHAADRVDLRPLAKAQETISWPYGEVRGGTPPFYDAGLDGYVTFFHSSSHAVGVSGLGRYYVMGMAVLEPHPPFAVKAMLPQPVVAPGMYDAAPRGKSVVFPQGVLIEGDTWHVSYGRNDDSIGIISLQHEALVHELQEPLTE